MAAKARAARPATPIGRRTAIVILGAGNKYGRAKHC